jgi:hypothetical protein
MLLARRSEASGLVALPSTAGTSRTYPVLPVPGYYSTAKRLGRVRRSRVSRLPGEDPGARAPMTPANRERLGRAAFEAAKKGGA